MVELRQVGEPNGSGWFAFMSFYVFTELSYFSFLLVSSLTSRMSIPKLPVSQEKMLSIFCVSFVLALSFYVLLRYSSPLLLGVDKSWFYNVMLPGFLSKLPSITSQLAFFAVFFLFLNSSAAKKGIWAWLFLFYLIITVLVLGQKFSSFLIYISIALIVYGGSSDRQSFSKNMIIFGSLSVGVLLAIVLLSYEFIHGYGWIFVFSRVALQGQLLWVTLNNEISTILMGDNYLCYFQCGVYENGIDYISYHFLPSDVYEFYKDRGTGLSGFMPALQVFTFGVLGSIPFTIVASFVVGFFQALTVKFVRSHNLIVSFLLVKALFGLYFAVFTANNDAYRGFLLACLFLLIWVFVCCSAKTEGSKI